jgi:hypothetical protein
MNIISAMKLIALCSRLALTGLAAFILGAVLDTQPLALFAFAIATLVLLIVAGDYAPRTSLSHQPGADIVPFAPTPAPTELTAKLAA